MSEQYVVKIPEILTAVFAPNPTIINEKTVLTVHITEKTIELEPYYYFSGDIFAGEV